jgi:hypothetical protein
MSEMQFGGLCRGSWQWWCLLLVCMMAIPASATLQEGVYATAVPECVRLQIYVYIHESCTSVY